MRVDGHVDSNMTHELVIFVNLKGSLRGRS